MAESDRYYEEELNYLIEAGREYSRIHPDRARFLNLSDPRHRDPHVERLVEAFAFLAGNVRRKLDDDFPELTHSLLELVWPYHLRPIPSMALLEFKPLKGQVQERQVVPRGFLADSRPVSQGGSQGGSDSVPCRFRTAYDVDLYPFQLIEAGITPDEAGRPRLRLAFELLEGADPGRFRIDRLRFHLAGEPSVAFALYHLLRRQADSILLRWGTDGKRLLPEGSVRPVGFGDGEEVLPYPSTSFPGYRLLAEYFAFPEKFLFLDIGGPGGIGSLPLGPRERRFELEVRFRGRVPESLRPTTENFRLYVTPIVNSFARDGEPITVSQLKTRHRVLGDFSHPEAYEIFSVDEVEALRTSDGARFERHPFFSFRHDDEGADGRGVYHHVTHWRSPSGAWQTYLALISAVRGKLPGEETLSLTLTCTNGRLCQEVGIEEITRAATGTRFDLATFRNITRPTDPIYPRLGSGAEWKFVSQMALNLASLSDPAAFRALLTLYDPGERPANRQRIESIQGAQLAPREILDRGAPIRGSALTLTVDERLFDAPGDLLLFGEVLSEFLSLYSHVNSFTELIVHLSESGEILRWPSSRGRQILI
jgi:type VI secretion system protein ImpG